jgi:hypothetical protein
MICTTIPQIEVLVDLLFYKATKIIIDPYPTSR